MHYRYLIARCLIASLLLMVAMFAYGVFLIADILGYTRTNSPAQPLLFSPYSYRSLRYDTVDPYANRQGGRCFGATTTFGGIPGSHVAGAAYAVSAFVDHRHVDPRLSPSATSLRVLALIPRGATTDDIYCVVYYGDAITPANHPRTVAWSARVSLRYAMTDDHKHEYTGAILSCTPPPVRASTTRACNLGLYRGSSAPVEGAEVHYTGGVVTINDVPLKDINPEVQDRGKRLLDVCVSPLFGNSVSTRRLVEFIELYLLLGVRIIHFYNAGVSKDLLHVLQYYQFKNVVTVVRWTLPSHLKTKIWYHGQVVALNDCLYRHSAFTSHILFSDVDETLFTYGERTITDWLITAQKSRSVATRGGGGGAGGERNTTGTHPPPPAPPSKAPTLPVAAYCFSSSYCDRSTTTNEGEVWLSRYPLKSLTAPYRTKCLVKPSLLFEAGIHHVSRLTLDNAHRVVDVDAEEATIHHYRKCQGKYICQSTYVQENRPILMHYYALTRRINSSILDIKLNS